MLINETSFDLTKIYLDTSNSMAHIRMSKYEFFNNSILVKFLNLIEAKFNNCIGCKKGQCVRIMRGRLNPNRGSQFRNGCR